MAVPATRAQLKNYALRRLGSPVVHIELSDEQMDDRLDDAINVFQKFHFDGVERVYIQHQITATTITFASAATGTFAAGTTVTGGTSGATASVVDQAANNLSIRVQVLTGTFQDGETISGGGASATLAASDAVTLGDVNNHYLTVDSSVLSVVRVLSLDTGIQSLAGMKQYVYQSMLHQVHKPVEMRDFVFTKIHADMIQDIISAGLLHEFNYNKGQVDLYLDWNTDLVDKYIVLECLKIIDLDIFTKGYGNEFLKEYTTALFKKQWGDNLGKFRDVQLPGGIVLNGESIRQEAKEDIKELEEKLLTLYNEPPEFFTG